MTLFFRLRFFQYVLLVLASLLVSAQTDMTQTPDQVGFSQERLQRITQKFEEYMDDEKMAGSVILVARKGAIAYYEAIGMADIAAKK